MEKYYVINKELKRKVFKKWIWNEKEYKIRAIIARGLQLLGLLILIVIVGIAYFTVRNHQEDFFIGLLVGLGIGFIFGIIPFIIGQSIEINARKEYGDPYNTMEREFLVVSNDKIEFGYHDIECEDEYENNMDIYEIPRENINAVLYDSEYNILTIIGKGKLTSYEDMQCKIINEEGSQRKFYNESPYEIMLAFDEKEEIVKLLKEIAKYKNDEEI